MNYIGSKHTLMPWILSEIKSHVSEDLSDKIFCDLFAGTGIVGRNFKPHVKQIIANDLEYYSFVLNQNYIANHQKLKSVDTLIKKLNDIKPKKGFIFKHYALGGENERQYFSDENAMKIDAIREEIERLKKANQISQNEYFFLLCSLLESADRVANTASVYGAFLKHLKKTAQKKLELKAADFEVTKNSHKVYNADANELIKSISGDILYLDPPYNARQYGANYHLLNTIAKYDNFVPSGKTGLRDYERSNFCKKSKLAKSFEELIKNARFRYIFLSYNNEGLLSIKEIENIMQKYGKYSSKVQTYQRFRADKSENRNHKANKTCEYLHILLKS